MSSIEPTIKRNTEQWELAERLTFLVRGPEMVIQHLFEESVISLQQISERQFDDSLKKRVWDLFSPEFIRKLKDTLSSEFCAEILVNFTDDNVAEMHEEYEKTGVIANLKFNYYKLNKMDLLTNRVVERSQNILMTEIIPAIMSAFEEEGVKFTGLLKKSEKAEI